MNSSMSDHLGIKFYVVALSRLLGVAIGLFAASFFFTPGWWMRNYPSPSIPLLAMRYSSDAIQHDVVRERVDNEWKGSAIQPLIDYIRWAPQWNEKMEKTEWLIGLGSQDAYQGIFFLLDEIRGTSFDEKTFHECLVGRLKEIEKEGALSEEMLQFLVEQLSKRELRGSPVSGPPTPAARSIAP